MIFKSNAPQDPLTSDVSSDHCGRRQNNSSEILLYVIFCFVGGVQLMWKSPMALSLCRFCFYLDKVCRQLNRQRQLLQAFDSRLWLKGHLPADLQLLHGGQPLTGAAALGVMSIYYSFVRSPVALALTGIDDHSPVLQLRLPSLHLLLLERVRGQRQVAVHDGLEVAGVEHLLFDLQPREVAGFQHRGDDGAGLLRHHRLPVGGVDGDEAGEAVEAGGGGTNDPRRGRAGGGAQAGDQQLRREAVRQAAGSAR